MNKLEVFNLVSKILDSVIQRRIDVNLNRPFQKSIAIYSRNMSELMGRNDLDFTIELFSVKDGDLGYPLWIKNGYGNKITIHLDKKQSKKLYEKFEKIEKISEDSIIDLLKRLAN